jgi:digeranylgeranylglycerophospholipid reductase
MTVEYDVLVVGAGPAGSRVARDIARAGYHVALIEQHRQVGLPCHCSGLVSPRTLLVADVGDDIVINTITGATVHVPGDGGVAFHNDRANGYVINRPELDRRLAQQAIDTGAELLLQTHFHSFKRATNASGAPIVVADVVRDGAHTQIAAHLLVGADGAHSRVGLQMRGFRHRAFVRSVGAEVEYENPSPSRVGLFVDPHAAPGWFGWTIPVDATHARIGTGTTDGITPGESLERLRSAFPEALGGTRIVPSSGGYIPLWQPTEIVDDNIMLVGDAARQVKPMSGGGIYTSLVAAGLAANAAVGALRSQRLSRRDLLPYPSAWDKAFGSEMRRQVDMRRIVDLFSLGDWQRLASGVRKGRRAAVLSAVGDIDYPSRAALALLVRGPMVAALARSVIRHPIAWAGALTRR